MGSVEQDALGLDPLQSTICSLLQNMLHAGDQT